ncbi:hypothetical protein GCM10010199_45620 [Dactylosporangium roseum]
MVPGCRSTNALACDWRFAAALDGVFDGAAEGTVVGAADAGSAVTPVDRLGEVTGAAPGVPPP